MTFFHVLALLGGLSIFLFGMNIMGKALEKQADNKLQNILTHLTDNPLKGFLIGAAVTAVLQSSSATTVMVVSLINSGLMYLHQAVGVIIGSNVGTTVTSWLLSIAGIQSHTFGTQIFQAKTIVSALAFAGIILYLFLRKERQRSGGLVLLGFSVLMIGMLSMEQAVKPLAGNPQFLSLLAALKNPILGILTGTILTALFQSSSASVGILQAFSVTGVITYGSAIPIIMGQNIGSCITALISAVGTNRNARRAAAVHLYFNLIGVGLFLILFYALDSLLHFTFVDTVVNQPGIAMVHTAFNLFAACIMLPFHSKLEHLAILTIPDDKQPEKIQLLDERLLATPALAVERARFQTLEMANLARSTLLQAMSLTHKWDKDVAAQITENEKRIDEYEDKLGTYLVRLSSRSLTVEDSHCISVLLHIIGDFERIGDHAVNLLSSARELHGKEIHLTGSTREELSVLESAIQEILNHSIESFQHSDLSIARTVEPLEDTIDDLVRETKNRHVQRLQSGEDTILQGFILSDLLTNYERVADHCSNIAIALMEAASGKFDTHKYLSKMKEENSQEFEQRARFYHYRYMLPSVESKKKAGEQL